MFICEYLCDFKVLYFDYGALLGFDKLELPFFSIHFGATNPFCNNANLNSPNPTKPTMSPNVILGFFMFVSWAKTFQKAKEKGL